MNTVLTYAQMLVDTKINTTYIRQLSIDYLFGITSPSYINTGTYHISIRFNNQVARHKTN